MPKRRRRKQRYTEELSPTEGTFLSSSPMPSSSSKSVSSSPNKKTSVSNAFAIFHNPDLAPETQSEEDDMLKEAMQQSMTVGKPVSLKDEYDGSVPMPDTGRDHAAETVALLADGLTPDNCSVIANSLTRLAAGTGKDISIETLSTILADRAEIYLSPEQVKGLKFVITQDFSLTASAEEIVEVLKDLLKQSVPNSSNSVVRQSSLDPGDSVWQRLRQSAKPSCMKSSDSGKMRNQIDLMQQDTANLIDSNLRLEGNQKSLAQGQENLRAQQAILAQGQANMVGEFGDMKDDIISEIRKESDHVNQALFFPPTPAPQSMTESAQSSQTPPFTAIKTEDPQKTGGLQSLLTGSLGKAGVVYQKYAFTKLMTVEDELCDVYGRELGGHGDRFRFDPAARTTIPLLRASQVFERALVRNGRIHPAILTVHPVVAHHILKIPLNRQVNFHVFVNTKSNLSEIASDLRSKSSN